MVLEAIGAPGGQSPEELGISKGGAMTFVLEVAA
jgi:hypothetical protein